ncbi:hypothetical protein EVAR_89273_1 [Eumeta japonica]|uniref:Uncharacterized protein n=1 Tax=Eumeta variegata TaxID=151549 RepID=A0A4C1VKI5_EUMVA|nr:hypothetical protein EVAR_89273_1 [Eumeta japonica]
MNIALNERALTVEMVKSVSSCDQLDEVAAIKVILMLGKDDYACLKSYHIIGLPVLQKTVESILVGHLQLHLMKNASEAVWLHVAARDGGHHL